MMFQTKHYADFIRVSLLGSVLAAIADPWLAYLRMEEKAKRYVFITFIGSILSISISVWLVLFMHLGVRGMVFGGTIAYAILLLVIWVTVARHLDFVVDISLFRPLVRIGFPSIFGLLAFLCIDYIDRQMIERMLGLTELGIYSIGCSFGMAMSIATGAFATAWPPFFMSYIQKRTEARQVFGRVLTYYVIGFGSLVVLFFCVAKPLVLLMTSPAFYEAYLVIGLVAAGYALKGCYLIILPGIFFAEKLYLQSIVEWVTAVMNIVLNLWLIPIHGIVGAAMATFFSYLTLPILAWMVSRYYLEVDYQWKRLMLASVVITFTAVFLFQLSVILNEGLVETILVNMIMLIGFFSISYWLLLNNIERTQLRRRLKG
jgi:O-antigen/teichoic acid export membrane protein